MTGCLTRRFEQVAVYDDSGADLLYHKFTVRAVGYVHGNSGNTEIYSGPFGSAGRSAPEMHLFIRSQLMEPRQPFKMEVSGWDGVVQDPPVMETKTLLECKPPASGTNSDFSMCDVNNGPKPLIYDVVRITGTNTFRVEFEVEIAKVECHGVDRVENSSGVLSNRWSVSDDIDNNRMTTRTFQGRLRVANANVNPNNFRQFVVPPLEQGFRRDKMAFVASADGLNLDYTIIEKEIAYSAPFPATSWRYHYTESTGDGKMAVGEISVDLEGDRNVDHKVLIAIAYQIVNIKLLSTAADGHTVENISVTDRYGDHENGISLRATVRHNLDKAILGNIFDYKIGVPLQKREVVPADLFVAGALGEYNRNISIDPGLMGRLPYVAAFSTYLQRPCSRIHAITDNQNLAEVGTPAGSTVTSISTYSASGDLPTVPTPYSASHLAHPYAYYRAESHYTTSGGKVHVPVAKRSSSTDETEATSRVARVGPTMTTRRLRISV